MSVNLHALEIFIIFYIIIPPEHVQIACNKSWYTLASFFKAPWPFRTRAARLLKPAPSVRLSVGNTKF